MLKKLGMLFSWLILFMACASGPFVSDGTISPSFLFTAPREGELVFLGVAGKRSSHKETLKYALEDAARRVAIFNRVSGEYEVESSMGAGIFGISNNPPRTDLDYDKDNVEVYVDRLNYNAENKSDTIEVDKTVFIRTTYPGALPFPINYRPTYSLKDKKPSWVDNPNVVIQGYEVGIGYSWRQSSPYRTWINSYNNAVFSIIKNINFYVRSEFVIYQNTGDLFGNTNSTNKNTTYSSGTLYGFYILDAWMDPATKAVWTLAIARKAQ